MCNFFLIGGGRKVRDREMDFKLLNWYYINHDKQGKKITVKEFKMQAKKFSSIGEFKASKGWLEKFKKRYHIQFK